MKLTPRFCPETRPHKGFYHRRGSAKLRIETRGERGVGAKDAISGWKLVGMVLGSLNSTVFKSSYLFYSVKRSSSHLLIDLGHI